MRRHSVSVLGLLLGFSSAGFSAGHYYELSYPPSDAPNALKLGVTYTLWIPDGAGPLRGIIVHQHGCGAGACQGGATAAYDLHWQVLAKKWGCALLGPSYQQADSQDCSLWSNPSNGSEWSFLKALDEFGAKTGHPEMVLVPWCLWGHSGGGYWAGEMQLKYPERIVAVWQRSGAARFFREKDPAQVSEAAYQVPLVCNPGIKEKSDRFARIWDGMVELTKTFRAKGAPVCLAPDPRTSHECGDSRYLAIPFFDACLEMRLPKKPGEWLKPVDMKHAWFAPLLGSNALPAAKYDGRLEEAIWLPNAKVAKAWSEYIRTGSVSDDSPPPAPLHLRADVDPSGVVTLTWDAEADFESGLGAFVIRRDGRDLKVLPEKPIGRFGRPLFQAMSYHDTPEKPLPQMSLTDASFNTDAKHRYEVLSVNSVGLRSRPAKIAVTTHSLGSKQTPLKPTGTNPVQAIQGPSSGSRR